MTHKCEFKIFGILCAALYLSHAAGQTPAPKHKADSIEKAKTHALEDVVVTARYQPGTGDNSTYKIKVVDAEKIQSLAAVNLKDALSNELNIRFSQDPVLGSGMSLQGLSGQNVKILMDGVPVIGRQNGNLDLSQINISNVERIEVVEGPLSVNYGTNALAGVINIITKKPRQGSLGVNANTYYETNNSYNAGLGLTVKKKYHGFSINVNRNYFNGWNLNDAYYFLPEKTLADTSRFKSWKPKEQYFGDFQYNLDKSRFKLSYRAALFDELIINRGAPLKPYREAAFDDYYKTNRCDNTVTTTIKFKNFKSYNNTLAYNYYKRVKNTYYKDLTNLSEQLSYDAALHDTALFTQLMARGSFISGKPYVTFEDSMDKHNRVNYEVGYDLNYNSAFGKRIEGKAKTIGDYAVFASAEIQPVKDLIIRPGVRYAYNTVYKSPVTPSFNIKYNLGGFTYRASYARGFRAPDLKELYFEFVDINHNIKGNTGLRAEQSNNFNASVKYAGSKNENGYSIELAGFYNNINQLINLALVGGSQYSYVNIGKFISYGSSLNGTYKYKNLSLSAGGALIARYNDLSKGFEGLSEYSYTPEGRASVQYKFEDTNTGLNFFYKYTGELPGYSQDADGNVSQTLVQAFSMADANLSQQLFKNRLGLSVGVKNILNINNVTASLSGGAHSGNSSSTPIAMGRTYFIRLQYAFQK